MAKNNVKLTSCSRSVGRAGPRCFRLSRLMVLLFTSPAWAEDYFNLNALELSHPQQQSIDLSLFLSEGQQPPGKYRVDIWLNGNQVESRDVTFILADGKLYPELTPAELKAMGVKTEAFPALSQRAQNEPFIRIGDFLPDASTRFDFSTQRLDISIPQAALDSQARGHIDPALWDQGMPALMFNYAFRGANTRTDGASGNYNSYYLNLRSGANLGAWRLRNYSSYTEQSGGERKWQNISTYLERDIQFLKSQLVLGDSYSPGTIFDSVQFRGAQLASDDNMLPDSLRGFAPVIHGIAQSNAKVSVSQNGYVIYQTYVTPGAFTITDLYPTSASGDLTITVTEADGTERKSVQPFSSVPLMVRAGQWKYSLTGGQYQSANDGGRTPAFAQGTLSYGLPATATLYGGVQLAAHYQSAAIGIGKGLGNLGSVSADVTQSSATLRDDSSHRGQSYRFQYDKSIADTGTSFTLAGYRYSTSGFYDFKESNELDARRGDGWNHGFNKRSRAQATITQAVNDNASFYLSAYQQDYWRQSGFERSLSTGLYLGIEGISYNLNYTYSQNPGLSRNDQQMAFSVQIPLSKWLPNSWASYNVSSSKGGPVSQQLGLSGTAMASGKLSYNLQQSHTNRGGGEAGSISASYTGPLATTEGGYNYGRGRQQINYGLQGGVVAHPYGVTLSQPLGDTIALVRAEGAADVALQNYVGLTTDSRGFAVVPYASPYRSNRIALDTESMSDDIDVDTHTHSVVPTKGAVVLASFQTRVGSRVLMTLNYRGKPVPFGAIATLAMRDGEAENSRIVGDNGQLYLSGAPEKGKLSVKWGTGAGQHCDVNFTLPVENKGTPVRLMTAECR